jgi:uncharacterized protein YggE
MSENRSTAAPFVEVLADASYEEPIERFIADLELEVRGASDDSALQQVAELSRRCVERLTAAGLARDEIEDAGLAMRRPWWTRTKETGKEATHKLRLRCADLARLNRALAALDGVGANQRETVNLSMRQPVFRDDDAPRAEALRRAVRVAREKASAVAAEAGATLGDVLQVIEAPSSERGSGFGDDNDWWGDSGRFRGAAAGLVMGEVMEGPEPLATPSRTIWVRCRVRFALG